MLSVHLVCLCERAVAIEIITYLIERIKYKPVLLVELHDFKEHVSSHFSSSLNSMHTIMLCFLLKSVSSCEKWVNHHGKAVFEWHSTKNTCLWHEHEPCFSYRIALFRLRQRRVLSLSLFHSPPAAIPLHSTVGGGSGVVFSVEWMMPGSKGRVRLGGGVDGGVSKQARRPCAFPISLVTTTWDSRGFDRWRSPTCSCLTSQKQPSENT